VVVEPVGQQERLLDLLAAVKDPRDRRGRRHGLAALVAVALYAVIAGARGFTAVGQWAAECSRPTLSALGMNGPAADESTFRRLFAVLDGGLLDRVLGAWAATRLCRVDGMRVIPIDGKTLRGARSQGGRAPHLVAALCGTSVIGQVRVAAKSNEIPAARDLVDLLDVEGAVVTMDALHTHAVTAARIRANGGHWLLSVKANQKHLHHRLKALPWTQMPGHTTHSTGHGRRETRTIKVADIPGWIAFDGAAQVAQLRRTVWRKKAKNSPKKKTVEVVYLITSADAQDAPALTLAAWSKIHWGIENKIHHVRDVTYDEDRSQVRTGNAPQVMATLRNLAIALLHAAGHHHIAHAHRHMHRDETRPLHLVLTA
jgi:predicted transposase YbfD/YdcC